MDASNIVRESHTVLKVLVAVDFRVGIDDKNGRVIERNFIATVRNITS